MEENKEEVVFDDVIIEEYDDSNASKFDRFFGVTKLGSKYRTEIVAGLITFLSMCYILTLNPTIIADGGGMPQLWSSIFIATAIAAVIGTLLMALVAKMPLAQASGLGLNSMISLLISGLFVKGKVFSFGTAMFLVFLSGVVFILVSIVPIGRNKETGARYTLREKIFDSMPKNIRKAISVGIGLFIAFIGLQNAGIIQHSDSTLVTFVGFNDPSAWQNGGPACCAIVALTGFVVVATLSHFKIKGAVIIGMVVATLAAIPMGVADINVLIGNKPGITWEFWTNFGNFFKMPADGGTFLAAFRDINYVQGTFFACVMVVMTFSMVDMFDTMGTILGCTTNAGLVDKNGKPLRYNRMMLADSVATLVGAVMGASSVTTFVESGSGIAAGGKTGLTALTTAILFLLSIFILPIFAFIPSAACASALLYVGVLMMANVKEIDFADPLEAVPAFLTIVFMPLAYSITTGIGQGVLIYVIINGIAYHIEWLRYKMGKIEEKPVFKISIVTIVISILFIIYFFVPVSI